MVQVPMTALRVTVHSSVGYKDRLRCTQTGATSLSMEIMPQKPGHKWVGASELKHRDMWQCDWLTWWCCPYNVRLSLSSGDLYQLCTDKQVLKLASLFQASFQGYLWMSGSLPHHGLWHYFVCRHTRNKGRMKQCKTHSRLVAHLELFNKLAVGKAYSWCRCSAALGLPVYSVRHDCIAWDLRR